MKGFTILAFAILANISFASDLKIAKPILYIDNDSAYAVFNLEWKNAWKNQQNNDAIWLFCKLKPKNGPSRHIKVMPSGHQLVSTFSGQDSSPQIMPSTDGVGLFVSPQNNFKGNINVTLKIHLDRKDFKGANTKNSSFDVFGIEMVRIPSGSFFIGSTNNSARKYGAFYDPKGNAPIKIVSENQVFEISNSGDIYYDVIEGYEGDQIGRIPSDYPKGYKSFFIMKYELTEKSYVDFLNNLTPNQAQELIIHEEDNYSGKISLNSNKYVSDQPNRPCSFVGWDDAMAFADWAGLRPMTEFEYTKAARGGLLPKGVDYPWGLEGKQYVQRIPDENGNLIMRNGWDESKLSDENKVYFGASNYGVMDLSGSLWERVISIGHKMGRSFRGTHGDGFLTEKGRATNSDWPNGDENSGGIGFRGGGFYGYNREYHEFNPFSPVPFRPYGSWHGAVRSVAYGTRFVRTNN